MSPMKLSLRDTQSRELMDDPNCDPVRLENTYKQFSAINRAISGWSRLYRERIRPQLHHSRVTTLLDIGFGGGDISRALARWAQRDHLRLEITAIDPDDRALEHVRNLRAPHHRYERATSADLVARGNPYDIVVSNHLLHHLDSGQLRALLSDSEALTRSLVIHNDLARVRAGYAIYAAATWPLSRSSFVHQDGLLSIRRSYTIHELNAAAPQPWQTETMFPQRLLLTYTANP